MLGRFLPAWHRIDRPRGVGGPEGLREVIRTLQGVALPAAQWETEVFPRRLGGYSPAWIDELAASGEIVWIGAGGSRVAIYLRDELALLGPAAPVGPAPEDDDRRVAVRAALGAGALFWDDLVQMTAASPESTWPPRSGASPGRARSPTISGHPLRAPRRLAVTVPRRAPRTAAAALAQRGPQRGARGTRGPLVPDRRPVVTDAGPRGRAAGARSPSSCSSATAW